MPGGTRTVRFAIVGFATVAILVLSGLTWATVASLRLERATHERQAALQEAQAQVDLHNRLEIARLRMDREIWPVLIREASRDYTEYEPIERRGEASSGISDAEELPPRIEGTESWIALHFQVTEELCWTSPQLPAARPYAAESAATDSSARGSEPESRSPHVTCVVIDESDPAAVERKELLDQMMAAYAPEDFAERIVPAWDASAEGLAGGNGEGSLPGADDNLRQRQSQSVRLQKPFLPRPLTCETQQRVYRATGRYLLTPAEEDEKDFFDVRVNEMTAIERPLLGGDVPKVVVVRRVDIGSDRVFQGFVVDLAKLTEALAARVRDLFSEVKLEPVHAPRDPDRPATQLGSLPVRLVVPQAAIISVPAHTSLVSTIVGFAWGTAVVALAAIGLGVKRLVSLSERRKEFTYAVTHELRTPLTTFQLYTDMLSAGLVPEEKRSSYLATLHRESKRLAELIAEVLEFSRVESNAVQAQMRNHPIRELMDAVYERYAERCNTAGLTLSLDVNGTGDKSLYTDPHIALQVLGTLIDNACKYAWAPDGSSASKDQEPKTTAPTVRLRTIDAGNKLAIEVADNGHGISSKDRSNLFKPFRRGSGEGLSEAGGVGLGLALAKRWARLIHGRLELVDRPQQRGACFRLTLPAGRP